MQAERRPVLRAQRPDAVRAERPAWEPLATSYLRFAMQRGMLGEVFYPRIDLAALKDVQLVVTDGE
jgi:hypothetical protein